MAPPNPPARAAAAPDYADTEAFFRHFDAVLAPLGLRRADSGGSHQVTQSRPPLASVHQLHIYAGLSMLAAAHASVALGRARGGCGQNLRLDLSDAALALNPERLFSPRLNGRPYAGVGIAENPYLRAPYRCRDGAHIMLSALYPAMAQRISFFLGCAPTEAAVAHAVGQWDGSVLEDALCAQGVAATVCRSMADWRRHPQAQVLDAMPVAGFRWAGAAPPRRRAHLVRPLEGYRVLSFGRALAGPITGRTLAEQGADVLGIAYPGYTEHEAVWCEANVGHRSATLSLHDGCDRHRLSQLLQTADVVINNHQSPRLASFGLDASSVLQRHPGCIYVEISAFGAAGPWAGRSGFDMNASAATGIMVSEGSQQAPRLPDCHLMHDVVAGYLGAASVAAALRAQLQSGGSYKVNLSLARCAMWCQNLGLIAPQASAPLAFDAEHLRLIADTPLGVLERMAPCVTYSQTPSAWREPILVRQGSSAPQWLPRESNP